MLNRFGAWVVVAALCISGQAMAQDHSHDHAHDHDHAQVDKDIYEGRFKDEQVADRPLSDYAGDWQSVYPLLLDGTLDGVLAHKAAHGDKSAAEYRSYYDTGYRTDVHSIQIRDDEVIFHDADSRYRGTYAADGHQILTYAKGNRGVRFIFRKTEGDEKAPDYIQFSDHGIAPGKAWHFHIYRGSDRAALLEEVTHWPTYYPAALGGQQIADEMIAH